MSSLILVHFLFKKYSKTLYCGPTMCKKHFKNHYITISIVTGHLNFLKISIVDS